MELFGFDTNKLLIACKVSDNMVNNNLFLTAYLNDRLKPKLRKGYKAWKFGDIESYKLNGINDKNVTYFAREYQVIKVPRIINYIK